MEISPDWIEKVIVAAGTALVAVFGTNAVHKRKELQRENVVKDGQITELERLRGLQEGCEEEVRSIHERYAAKLEEVHASYSEKLQSIRESYNKILTNMLKEYDDVIKANFDLRIALHNTRTELIQFHDSQMVGGRRVTDPDPPAPEIKVGGEKK